MGLHPVGQEQGDSLDFQLQSEGGGQCCGAEPSTCGLCALQVDSVKTDSNCRVAGVRRTAWCGEKPHTVGDRTFQRDVQYGSCLWQRGEKGLTEGGLGVSYRTH